jgi:hypothetical protein
MKKYRVVFIIILLSITVFSFLYQGGSDNINKQRLISLNSDSTQSDTTRIIKDLQSIISFSKPRNYKNPEILDSVADYIYSELEINCDTVFYQSYSHDGRNFKNVIARIGDTLKPKLVVGAHYDVCGDSDGADDNATGVTGVLELSRLIKKDSLRTFHIEFVAYTLEEPPYFRTDFMGSHIHAKKLFVNNINVKGMICLEMLGYFDDSKNSQNYPLKALKAVYGSKGDFITVVHRTNNGEFGDEFSKLMKEQNLVKTEEFKGPQNLEGIDFSDHLNYWRYGYSALMITDTGHMRNVNYHKKSDKIATLDLPRMKAVIDEVCFSVLNLN